MRLFECRAGYRGHGGSFSTNVLGLGSRLERDKAENLESGFPIASVIDLDGRKVRVRVFAFSTKEKAKEYRTARQGIVFAVNGQSHATFPIDFFRRKSVGMGYLADSLLMIVDCSGIEGQMREDLFMNSRDRLRETKLSQRLEQELERAIKDEPTLRALRNSRRAQELADKLADSKPLTNVLEDLLRRSPTLAKLFLQGVKLSSPFPPSMGAGEGGAGEFRGKTYPTYFRFRGMASGEDLQRDAHVGSSVRVAFETDGADDYFVRDLDPGTADLLETTNETRSPVGNWVMRGPQVRRCKSVVRAARRRQSRRHAPVRDRGHGPLSCGALPQQNQFARATAESRWRRGRRP